MERRRGCQPGESAQEEAPFAETFGALAWTLDRPGVATAIAGSTTPEHGRANAGAAGIDLDRATVERPDAATEDEYIVSDRGSVRGSEAFDDEPPISRFADGNSFWIYQSPGRVRSTSRPYSRSRTGSTSTVAGSWIADVPVVTLPAVDRHCYAGTASFRA